MEEKGRRKGKIERGEKREGNKGYTGGRNTANGRNVRCRVRSTVNNTKVVRSWYDEEKGRRVNLVKTGGRRGFVNSKRGSVYAAQEVRGQAGKTYLERWGGKTAPGVHVLRRGMGRGRVQALNELKKVGVEILTVSDGTKDGHNGCRRKKQRRV